MAAIEFLSGFDEAFTSRQRWRDSLMRHKQQEDLIAREDRIRQEDIARQQQERAATAGAYNQFLPPGSPPLSPQMAPAHMQNVVEYGQQQDERRQEQEYLQGRGVSAPPRFAAAALAEQESDQDWMRNAAFQKQERVESHQQARSERVEGRQDARQYAERQGEVERMRDASEAIQQAVALGINVTPEMAATGGQGIRSIVAYEVQRRDQEKSRAEGIASYNQILERMGSGERLPDNAPAALVDDYGRALIAQYNAAAERIITEANAKWKAAEADLKGLDEFFHEMSLRNDSGKPTGRQSAQYQALRQQKQTAAMQAEAELGAAIDSTRTKDAGVESVSPHTSKAREQMLQRIIAPFAD